MLVSGATSKSPPWLPRYVTVGSYYHERTLTPTVHLGWEWAAVEQKKTSFVIVAELGPGFAVLRPAGVSLFYQHVLQAGVGLRSGTGLEQLHWGLSVMAGPMLHGLACDNGACFPEQRVNGIVEGRGQLGADVGPVVIAAFVGFAQPFSVLPRSSAVLAGGVTFGLLVNWR